MYLTHKKILRTLEDLASFMYPEQLPIDTFKMKEGEVKDAQAVGLSTADWKDFGTTDRWGGRDKHYWFRAQVTLPKNYSGKTVVLQVKTGKEGQWDATNPQFLIYINGQLQQGLDVNHTEVLLSHSAQGEDNYSITLHAYSGMNDGLVELSAVVKTLDKVTEELYYNLRVPHEVAMELSEGDKRRLDIYNYLNQAANLLDLRKPFSPEFHQSVREANDYLEKKFYGKFCGESDVTVTCVGHTHIDVAWLWTLAQTREKVARSFSTVLNLMKQYPEYTFMSSQPQLYQYLKEDHPDLYAQVQERVKEGRWEPEGAMWLEADCNLASGESLIRQVMFGTRFFEREFGVKNKILWLPDVFGYSAALPQILKKSGIDYFMTTKISWNEYNTMPNDTFLWEGLDGTSILTHFITARSKGDNWLHDRTTTYNGDIKPSQMIGGWERYHQKELGSEILNSFGFGDGGGGPTKEMLENARRLEKGIPGCPKVQMGKAKEFFQRLEQTVMGNKRLPRWVGELYLEYHRGTYTTMARNKKFNRRSEFTYQDAELFSIMSQVSGTEDQYPQEQLNNGWETLLLNQFHDILPGSSIKEVYEDSDNDYERILSNGNTLINKALEDISQKVATVKPTLIVFNQLSFKRTDVVQVPLPSNYENTMLQDSDGNATATQVVEVLKADGSKETKLFFLAKDVPSKGYKGYTLSQEALVSSSVTADISNDLRNIQNQYYRVSFDESMNISSLYDKSAQREVLKPGMRANVIQAFEDKPAAFDAWDINLYYQEKMWEVNDLESVEVVENGPVRATIRIKRKFLDSVLIQEIYFYNDLPRIDFRHIIDWKEKHILLKAAFPIDVHTQQASFEIQYGNVVRPTHWNTSWDYARFEVCAHKWVDLSEDGYGVSLLNDCKYGHDIKDGIMRLTLLKSSAGPNVDADREVHEFTYSIYPHTGDWKAAKTIQMAYRLNCPMVAKLEGPHLGELPLDFSLLSLDQENVVIEVVKKAEDSDDIIVRLYECYNRRVPVTLTFCKKLMEVWECDLMENNLEKLPPSGNQFTFTIKPYEIKTFKIKI